MRSDLYTDVLNGTQRIYDQDPSLINNLKITEIFVQGRMLYVSQSLLIVGAYMGVCIDVIYLGGTPQNINRTNSRTKAICRVALLTLILYIVLAFTNVPLFTKFNNTNRSILQSLFSFVMPALFFPIFMFSVLKLLFTKLKLDRASQSNDNVKETFI